MAIVSGGGGGGSGAITRIANSVLASPAASIAVSSISATYTHLLVVYSLRSAVTSETTALTKLRFNGDTGSNYGRQHIWGQNTGANVATSGGLVTAMDVLIETGPSAVASGFSQGTIFVPYYSSTTQLKQVISNVGAFGATGATTNWFAATIAGLWNSTAAINAVTFFASDLTSNLATGSSVSIYGIT